MLFLSLAPYLHSEEGHSLSYHLAVEKGIKSLGWDFFALVAEDCTLSLPHNWIKIFPKKVREGSLARAFFSFMRALLFKRKEKRILFLEGFSTRLLLSLFLSSILVSQKKIHLWILLRYGKHQLPLKGKLHRALFSFFSFQYKKRFKLLTDSEEILKEWENQIALMPVPHGDWKVRETMVPYSCWWPGTPKQSKGWEEVKTFAKKAEGSKLVLRAAENTGVKEAHLPRVLSEDQYREELAKAQFILLPYDPIIYKSGTSGIFIETVIAGKIPLVKKGSWLAGELKRYCLDELVIDWENKDLIEHILQIGKNRVTLQKLQAMQDAYASYHNPKTFATCCEKLV